MSAARGRGSTRGRGARAGAAATAAATEPVATAPTTVATGAPEIKVKSFAELMAEKKAKTPAPAAANDTTTAVTPAAVGAAKLSMSAESIAARREKLLASKAAKEAVANRASPSSPSQSNTVADHPVSAATETATAQPSPALTPVAAATSSPSSAPTSPALTAANRSHSQSKPHVAVHNVPTGINGVELTRTVVSHTLAQSQSHESLHADDHSATAMDTDINKTTATPVRNNGVRPQSPSQPQPPAKRLKRSNLHSLDVTTPATARPQLPPVRAAASGISVDLAQIDAEIAAFEAELKRDGEFASLDAYMAAYPLSLAEADEMLEEFEAENPTTEALASAVDS